MVHVVTFFFKFFSSFSLLWTRIPAAELLIVCHFCKCVYLFFGDALQVKYEVTLNSLELVSGFDNRIFVSMCRELDDFEHRLQKYHTFFLISFEYTQIEWTIYYNYGRCSLCYSRYTFRLFNKHWIYLMQTLKCWVQAMIAIPMTVFGIPMIFDVQSAKKG